MIIYMALQDVTAREGGTAFFSIPYDGILERTSYPLQDMPKEEIARICGWDHKRIYGKDFPEIISSVNFEVITYLLPTRNAEKYVTSICDPVFVAKKTMKIIYLNYA